MSSIFINGSQFRISTLLAQAVPVTEIANGADPLAKTTTPPQNKDVLVLSSGWSSLDETVFRASGVTADGFKIEGADTEDLRLYPAGQGAGSYREVSQWVSIDQITDVQISGGEQQYHTFQYVEDASGRQRQKPTFKSPVVLNYTVDYDRKKPWYKALITADRLRVPVVLETKYPDGSVTYYYGYPSFRKDATGGQNVNLQNGFTLSLLADSQTYDEA